MQNELLIQTARAFLGAHDNDALLKTTKEEWIAKWTKESWCESVTNAIHDYLVEVERKRGDGLVPKLWILNENRGSWFRQLPTACEGGHMLMQTKTIQGALAAARETFRTAGTTWDDKSDFDLYLYAFCNGVSNVHANRTNRLVDVIEDATQELSAIFGSSVSDSDILNLIVRILARHCVNYFSVGPFDCAFNLVPHRPVVTL